MTLDWRGGEGIVRWRAAGGEEKTVRGERPKPVPVSSAGPFWETTIGGLTPGERHEYRIGDGPWHRFRASPAAGAEFTVVAQGDIGATSVWPDVGRVQRMVAEARPDLVLVLGDLTYGDLRPSAVDQHFNDVMVWSQDAAYMPAWGNHEWENPPHDDLRNYKGRFALPHAHAARGAPRAGCCGEDWYWFDYGHTRFIAYPEPYARATWRTWSADVEPIFAGAQHDPAITFIVTFGHHPAYSTGQHQGVPALQAIMGDWGRRYSKYVLNLNGHSHNYERSAPQEGVVHLTAGIGGGALERARTPCGFAVCPAPAWSARRAIRHGVLRLRFAAEAIEGTMVCGPPSPGRDDIDCREGAAVDSFVIQKR
ncbi:MAG TPA: metallophosphoesterase [Polyangia bacterium]|nr:metallophosphoesterase [Polyangia bacterium]